MTTQQITDQTTRKSAFSMPVENHLFDEALHLTGVTEYGVSFEDFLNGRAEVPRQGARFDIAYEGAIEGPKLQGFIKGVDYLHVRADGRFQLNIYATLTTHDGTRIAVTSDALLKRSARPGEPAQIRMNMQFSTSDPVYDWVNDIQAWGTGTVDMRTREVSVRMYEA